MSDSSGAVIRTEAAGSHASQPDELYPDDSLTSEETGHLAINEILSSHSSVASTWQPLSHTLSCTYSRTAPRPTTLARTLRPVGQAG